MKSNTDIEGQIMKDIKEKASKYALDSDRYQRISKKRESWSNVIFALVVVFWLVTLIFLIFVSHKLYIVLEITGVLIIIWVLVSVSLDKVMNREYLKSLDEFYELNFPKKV